MKKIITTVGTSIFTNLFKNGQNTDIQGVYNTLEKANYSASEWNNKQVQEHIEGKRRLSQTKGLRKMVSEKVKTRTDASAEIKSILKITEEAQEDKIEVFLLATDTVLSVLACELIQDWFNPIENQESKERKKYEHKFKNKEGNEITKTIEIKFAHNDTHIIKDLRVDSAGNYEKGFMNLIEKLEELKLSKNDILNITGGYKAIIPILTLYGQLKEISLKYIYNETELDKTNELVTIGNLPINFDYSIFEDNYLAFDSIKPSKMSHNLPSEDEFIKYLENENIFKDLIDSFIIKIEDDKICLTVLGRMLYHSYENSLKEDGFNISNLVGKVMEIKVFEFFNQHFPKNPVILGKKIGKLNNANSYDIDVFVETEDKIWAIEVKPEGVKVFNEGDKIDRNSLQNKFENGAFKIVLDEYSNEKYQNMSLNLAIFMYHHKEPNKFQQENFKNLRKLEWFPCKYFNWYWIKPPKNYKGNVNWILTEKDIKKFNFETESWEDFSFK